LLNSLSIGTDYDIHLIVISQNDIGPDWAQDSLIPVIHADHFINKLSLVDSMKEITIWLQDRLYLPEEGKDYELFTTTSSIGDWNLEWYEFFPKIDGPLV